jgi:hypothetical protein
MGDENLCSIVARCEVFTAMKMQVVDLGVVTPCNDVAGYQRFEGPCCLHLKGEVL